MILSEAVSMRFYGVAIAFVPSNGDANAVMCGVCCDLWSYCSD